MAHRRVRVHRAPASSGAGRPRHARSVHDRGVSQYVLVHVDDVEAHCARAKEFGARIVRPPADAPFGERHYTAEDLAGHRWTFSQSVADVPLEAWGAVPAAP